MSLERECVECVECVCAINGKFVVIVPWPLRGRQRLSLYSSFFPSTPSGRRDIDDTRPLTSSLSAFLTRRRYSNHAAWARRHHALLNSLVRPAVLPVAAVRAANPQSNAHIRAAFPTSAPILRSYGLVPVVRAHVIPPSCGLCEKFQGQPPPRIDRLGLGHDASDPPVQVEARGARPGALQEVGGMTDPALQCLREQPRSISTWIWISRSMPTCNGSGGQ